MKKIFSPNTDNFPKTADVVVIGGGIVGVATAYWLSKAGLDTVLLEMRDGLSTLTTAMSLECFRTQFTEPAMAELALPSIDMFDNFADAIGIKDCDIAIKRQGYLFVTDDPEMPSKLQDAVNTHHSLGAKESEYLTSADLRKRFPYISPDMLAGTFSSRDGWLSSHEATQGFAKASNARFMLNTRVNGISCDGQGVKSVETNHGSIATRQVVNAAGPYAGVIGGMVGLNLPLEPVRRQKVFISARPEIPQDAPMCIDLSRETYWRPANGGALFAWVDPDEPTSAPSEEVETDWDYPAIVLDKLVKLSPFWADIANNLGARELQQSAGYYVYTPDDQPLIGPVSDVPGFHLNCGYWAGVMLSPEAGRRVAALVTGEMQSEDNALRYSRFEEGIEAKGDSFLRGRK